MVDENMIDYDLTAVIPARLASSRVEKKVFQEIAPHQTLLDRKINQLRKLLPKDRVIVNTESHLIAEYAEKSGAQVMWRDPFYADGHRATFSELIVHVVEGLHSEHVAWTPFVVPFFDENEFRESFNAYYKNVVLGEYDSLVSVVPIKEYLWSKDGPLNYEANERHTISQELPDWFRVTNGNYMAPKERMLEWKYILGQRVFLDVRADSCGVDIDTLHDLNVARAYELISKQ